MNKDLRKIIRALEDQGFEIVRTRKGRFEVRLDGRHISTLSPTATDYRSTANALGPLRRAGFRWPPRR